LEVTKLVTVTEPLQLKQCIRLQVYTTSEKSSFVTFY
jgi:hypothetical protein